MDDESGESMEPMEEVALIQLGEAYPTPNHIAVTKNTCFKKLMQLNIHQDN